MPLRIAIGGFQHETHSFAPQPTVFADFQRPGGFPPLTRGPGLPAALDGTQTALAGAMPVLAAAGATQIPLLWCLAMPAGPIEDAAFERIAAMLLADVSDALLEGPLDGVYLDLHGAALADSIPDVEGELLIRLRRILGPDVPVAISLDPHANLTAAMVAASDVVVPYRTYPHVDKRETGARTAELLLARIARGMPWEKVFRQIDYWMGLGAQCTMAEPMQGIMAARAAIADQHGVAELGFCFGFPYADFPDCGVAISCHAETLAQAEAATAELAALLEASEKKFTPDAMPVKQAVALALQSAMGARRPVIIADTQDNPGGGGHADTTGLLAELVAQGARGAVLCLINDADSAAAAHAAGQGAELDLALGGKSDGVPFRGRARVLALGDGDFVLTGPMGQGNRARLGPCTLLEFAPGIRVMVASRKTQAYDQAILRHLGVDPAGCPIVALKSSVHFRADYAPIAERIIVAAAPGPVIADPSTLPFRHLRPGLRLRAGDPSSTTGGMA
ncbi:M81 family metallopeptidase [Roseomonas sp. USHLN139]|uniref:M81 family metallopeptidase n=1 Tax=Roseomonas sp. USHLN139 TaxID=3081298 RepID=UPI003B020441